MSKKIIYPFIISAIALLLSGCIKSDLSHCDLKADLVIKALHTDGTDITSTGDAGNVMLFTFDDNGAFISKQFIPAQNIIDGNTIPVSIESNAAYRYVAWSNITDTVKMFDFDGKRNLNQNKVLPLINADGYADIEKDIFYGKKRVTGKDAQATPLIELQIRRALAQIHVSVVGLPETENPANYEIVIGNDDQTAFDFENQVQRQGSIQYKQEPVWLIDKKMMGTLKAFSTLPSPAGASKTVLLYKNGELLASATQDIEGKSIAPKAEQRVNVLIDLNRECQCPDDSGTIEIKIEVSDWNQVVEWKVW